MHKRIESLSGVMSINEEYTLNNKLNMQSKNQKNTFKIINIYLNLSVFIEKYVYILRTSQPLFMNLDSQIKRSV